MEEGGTTLKENTPSDNTSGTTDIVHDVELGTDSDGDDEESVEESEGAGLNTGARLEIDSGDITCFNEEFAVPATIRDTWAAEFMGGDFCEAFCFQIDDEDFTAGCNKVTALVCGTCLRAERVGNMPVLWARRRPGKVTELLCLVGPFWPCMAGVTYPLILGVSLFTAVFALPSAPAWVVGAWLLCTLSLLISLGLTACTNPGVVPRHADGPPSNAKGTWRWNDQVQSYRPPGATYDRDCGVVIEEFDHTCPWTGTGIGKRNMVYFQTFVSCICVCLIFNAVLVLSALEPGDNTNSRHSMPPSNTGPPN